MLGLRAPRFGRFIRSTSANLCLRIIGLVDVSDDVSVDVSDDMALLHKLLFISLFSEVSEGDITYAESTVIDKQIL